MDDAGSPTPVSLAQQRLVRAVAELCRAFRASDLEAPVAITVQAGQARCLATVLKQANLLPYEAERRLLQGLEIDIVGVVIREDPPNG